MDYDKRKQSKLVINIIQCNKESTDVGFNAISMMELISVINNLPKAVYK